MRYSYEYKKMCVELYRQGKWVETPEGVKEKNFRNMIQIWARTEESCGVNHKRVQRIMNQLALFGKRPKEKYHSYKGDVGKVADNIINRDFSTKSRCKSGQQMYRSSIFLGANAIFHRFWT